MGARLNLVVSIQNGGEEDRLKLKQVDECILSQLGQLKKNSMEKEVPFLHDLDFVCPTFTINVFSCLAQEIAFLESM